MKFVVNMMKGEQDKESVEQPEILALPAPSLHREQKTPPVQNGTPAAPTEEGLYVYLNKYFSTKVKVHLDSFVLWILLQHAC